MSRPRTGPEHGSCPGYLRHRKAREDACEDCLRAWRDYNRERARATRRLLQGGLRPRSRKPPEAPWRPADARQAAILAAHHAGRLVLGGAA